MGVTVSTGAISCSDWVSVKDDNFDWSRNLLGVFDWSVDTAAEFDWLLER